VPTVLRERGYRLLFFSNEGSPREPVHAHVRRGGALAKFWLDPSIVLAEAYGFTSRELRELEGIVRRHEATIRSAWRDHFGD